MSKVRTLRIAKLQFKLGKRIETRNLNSKLFPGDVHRIDYADDCCVDWGVFHSLRQSRA